MIIKKTYRVWLNKVKVKWFSLSYFLLHSIEAIYIYIYIYIYIWSMVSLNPHCMQATHAGWDYIQPKVTCVCKRAAKDVLVRLEFIWVCFLLFVLCRLCFCGRKSKGSYRSIQTMNSFPLTWWTLSIVDQSEDNIEIKEKPINHHLNLWQGKYLII